MSRISLILFFACVTVSCNIFSNDPGYEIPSENLKGLEITGIDADSPVEQGTEVLVTVTVSNPDEDVYIESAEVTLFDQTDSLTIGTESLNDTLDAGGTHQLIFHWDTGTATTGEHTLVARHGNESSDSEFAQCVIQIVEAEETGSDSGNGSGDVENGESEEDDNSDDENSDDENGSDQEDDGSDEEEEEKENETDGGDDADDKGTGDNSREEGDGETEEEDDSDDGRESEEADSGSNEEDESQESEEDDNKPEDGDETDDRGEEDGSGDDDIDEEDTDHSESDDAGRTPLSVNSISPDSMKENQSVKVTIRGTGFARGASVELRCNRGRTPDVRDMDINQEQITATVTSHRNIPRPGQSCSIVITNPDGSSAELEGALSVTRD